MALTRRFLSAMGIEPDKVDEIINAHVDTVDALKSERDAAKSEAEKYKADAEKLPIVKKELDELKDSQGHNVFETRYEEMKKAHDEVKEEFEKYKSDIAAKEVRQAKENAYRKLLLDANISEKRVDKILKVSDIDDLELTKDGTFKNADDLTNTIKDEWGDFIITTHTEGANVSTPNSVNVQVPKGESRAAKIAAQYHNNLYGETKEAK